MGAQGLSAAPQEIDGINIRDCNFLWARGTFHPLLRNHFHVSFRSILDVGQPVLTMARVPVDKIRGVPVIDNSKVSDDENEIR